MTTFIVRRLLWSLPVLFVVVTIVFFMMRAIGGDPFRHGPLFGLSNVAWVKYGDYQPPSIRRNLEHRYGLDLPWYEQYANYVEGVFTLRLGPSLSFRGRTVNELVADHAPVSLELGLLAFAWALVLGVPLGVLAALRPGSLLDYPIRLVTAAGIALPNFLVASLLIYYLAVKVGWFPTNGWTTWRHKVLPSFTLGLLPTAYFARLIRGGLLDALAQDYITIARGKGLRAGRVVLVHGLRNALIPAVTVADRWSATS